MSIESNPHKKDTAKPRGRYNALTDPSSEMVKIMNAADEQFKPIMERAALYAITNLQGALNAGKEVDVESVKLQFFHQFLQQNGLEVVEKQVSTLNGYTVDNVLARLDEATRPEEKKKTKPRLASSIERKIGELLRELIEDAKADKALYNFSIRETEHSNVDDDKTIKLDSFMFNLLIRFNRLSVLSVGENSLVNLERFSYNLLDDIEKSKLDKYGISKFNTFILAEIRDVNEELKPVYRKILAKRGNPRAAAPKEFTNQIEEIYTSIQDLLAIGDPEAATLTQSLRYLSMLKVFQGKDFKDEAETEAG